MKNEGQTITFIPLETKHFPLLFKWFQTQHVAKWWDEGKAWSLEEVEEKYRTYAHCYKETLKGPKPIYPYIIMLEEEPIGYIQYYDAADFPREGYHFTQLWGGISSSIAALDFFIGEISQLGKGLGAASLKLFLQDYIFPKFSTCIVDPEKENSFAIKAYTEAGFVASHQFGSIVIMVAHKRHHPRLGSLRC